MATYLIICKPNPDFAALNPGYACWEEKLLGDRYWHLLTTRSTVIPAKAGIQ